MFRPPMWCVHDRPMDMRTNNSVERYCIFTFLLTLLNSVAYITKVMCDILLDLDDSPAYRQSVASFYRAMLRKACMVSVCLSVVCL